MKGFYSAIALLVILGTLNEIVSVPAPAKSSQILILEMTYDDLLKRGVEQASKGNYQGAIADLTEAIRLNPYNIK